MLYITVLNYNYTDFPKFLFIFFPFVVVIVAGAVFNFISGAHTVTRVTKEGYDSCNSTNFIAIESVSPARFTLDSVGDYYFICSVALHCPLGQKVAINVGVPYRARPSLLPPRLPQTEPLTTNTDHRESVSYVVGDKLGWAVPPGGALAYTAWASPKTFTVGDSLGKILSVFVHHCDIHYQMFVELLLVMLTYYNQ